MTLVATTEITAREIAHEMFDSPDFAREILVEAFHLNVTLDVSRKQPLDDAKVRAYWTKELAKLTSRG